MAVMDKLHRAFKAAEVKNWSLIKENRRTGGAKTAEVKREMFGSMMRQTGGAVNPRIIEILLEAEYNI